MIKAFIRDTRDDGTTFIRLADEHKDGWIRDAVYEAHDGMMPDDWVYTTCKEAFEEAQERDDADGDWIHEWADSQVDVYTKRLFQWAADFCTSSIYAEAEERAAEFGPSDHGGMMPVIQYCAIERIAQIMNAAWHEHKDDTDEG